METNILPGVDESELVYSCVTTPDDEPVGGEYQKGIYKAFLDKKGNQLEIDPYSCFVYAPFQALANFDNTGIDYEIIRATLALLEKDGKFHKGIGGKMIDGVEYALKAYNLAHSTQIKHKCVPLTAGSIIDALSSGSPMVTGIKYSKSYFGDEQDGDAWITNVESIGTMGHLISIVKINTMDDILVKFLENYEGKLKYNIIGVDFTKFRKLFFNTGVMFYK